MEQLQKPSDADELAGLQARVDDLTRQIEHHRFCYYVLSQPEITDSEFDTLYKQLEVLEKLHPELRSPHSPTQKVGAPPSTEFKQVKHRVALLSLANAMSSDELEKWRDRLVKSVEANDVSASALQYVCELKIDGLSVALTYRNGFLVEGATRGNGEVGEDVMLNLKTIASIPFDLGALAQKKHNSGELRIPELLEVRGEVYMPAASFAKLNEGLAEQGLQLFANPRNAASGALRQKDPKQTARRKLGFWAYFAYLTDPVIRQPESHFATLQLLEQLGFPVEPNKFLASDLEAVQKYCDQWADKRHQLQYQTDGVVIKADDRKLWDLLGATAHSPRWAVAYKYPPEEAETVVEAVHFDVGRTGAVTPLAWLKPVKLAGTTVKRATLHNADQIKRLDIHVGDTVLVRKAGEIIPEVLSVRIDRRPPDSQLVAYPTHCPVCQTPLERTGDEVAIRCPNSYGCSSQIKRRLEHWVSRDAMDVDGVGEALIEQLMRAEILKTAADLYKLTREQLLTLERVGSKSADNVIAAIAKSKTRPLANLIFALGIRHVGSGSAELLASRFHSLAALQAASVSDIEDVEGIGPTIASAVSEFFAHPEGAKLMDELREVGIEMEVSHGEVRVHSQVFKGQTFVLTGTLANMDRQIAEKTIKERGGKVTSSVTKKTNYVVCGEHPGSKLGRARELGIKVLSEEDFLAMLREAQGE